ncbi:hypothetical protein [Kocuria sp. ZOR0020]|uniref:hypothetical protein n=1 Tax=Kocuria sp. ZOR0020 TaxID=1339234 RepID=UPI000646F0C2|nr:hypothetical protein [Kocuria sp. ZOR0020]
MKGTSVAGKAGKMASTAGKAGRAGATRAIDFSKALAFDAKYKAVDLGLSAAERAVPRIAPAVQTINKFKNNMVDYSMAAKDTISSIRPKPGQEFSVGFGREYGIVDGPTVSNYRLDMTTPPVPEVGTSFKEALSSRTGERAAAEATKRVEPNILELRPNKRVLKDPSLLRQYHAKIDHLNGEARQGKLEYRVPEDRNYSRKDFIDNPTSIGTPDDFDRQSMSKYDLDHKTDLQLGGKDTPQNFQWLDKHVNRSVGSQLRWQMIKKNLTKGGTDSHDTGSTVHGIADKSRPNLLSDVKLEID